MSFANFWSNVSKITLGPNVRDETGKAIARGLTLAEPKKPTKKAKEQPKPEDAASA